eukprot:935932-Amphidinium_carterae.1
MMENPILSSWYAVLEEPCTMRSVQGARPAFAQNATCSYMSNVFACVGACVRVARACEHGRGRRVVRACVRMFPRAVGCVTCGLVLYIIDTGGTSLKENAT